MRIAILLITAGLTAACSPATQSIDIAFTVRYGDAELGCTSAPGAPALSDLRFFVHDVRLFDETGREIRVDLVADGRWQTDEVALLDFETGERTCVNGSPATNRVLRGHYRGRPATGLQLQIGVPEHLNHQDPLIADGPLTLTAMHWHWKSGYKFMRAGLVTADQDGLWLHLGSGQCAGTIGDIRGCGQANRPFVDLPEFTPGASMVVVDLERLTSGSDLRDGLVSECQSGPTEIDCAAPFAALGITFGSGDRHSPASLFTVMAR